MRWSPMLHEGPGGTLGRIVFAMLLLWMAASLRAETYDIYTFTPPPGWKRIQQPDFLVFTQPAQKEPNYCQIGVYKSIHSIMQARENFDAVWANSVKKSSGVDVPGEHKDVGDGWTLSWGSAKVDSPAMLSVLYVFTGYERQGVVLTNLTTEACAKDAEKFLGTMDLKPLVAPPPPTTAAAAPVPAARAESGAGVAGAEGSLVGMWWGLGNTYSVHSITNAAGTGWAYFGFSPKLKLTFLAFFPDGSFTDAVPINGVLDHRALRKRDPQFWGTYKFKNGKGTVVYDAGGRTTQFELKDGKIVLEKIDFRPYENPQGRRLIGTFSGHTEAASTITFAGDGRFVDRGALSWVLNEPNRSAWAGSGQYDIEFYTMVLKYDDGRRLTMAMPCTIESGMTSIRLGTSYPLLAR